MRDAVIGVLWALGISAVVTAAYLLLFTIVKKKWPSASDYGYLMLESATMVIIARVLVKMLNLEFVGKLGPDEHLMLGIGSMLVVLLIFGKLLGMFSSIFSNSTASNSDTKT